MNILNYYEVITSKISKIADANEGLMLVAPEQSVGGVRSVMVGLYVPKSGRYRIYTFYSTMNEGELKDKYSLMVGNIDAMKQGWDAIRGKRRQRT